MSNNPIMSSNTVMSNNPIEPSLPWWKFGYVWLVISGPAVVIVAGFVTLYLALSRPDYIVSEDYYQKGIEINKTLKGDAASLAPAIQGRNHAATGVAPAAATVPVKP